MVLVHLHRQSFHDCIHIGKREESEGTGRIKFRHPWTNGMVERFNGKVKKNVLRKYLFKDADDLKTKLTEYINDYNFTIKLKELWTSHYETALNMV